MLSEFKTPLYQFNPNQIVCLEYQNSYLYSEVIQVISVRQFCWVRPLMLVMALAQNSIEAPKLIDVRCTSDLIFPLHLFRPALDTEIIPLYQQMEELDSTFDNPLTSRYKLHKFIKEIWQNNPDIFKNDNL